jgi:glycosyltransferase involved in cell wall biosynthesis
LTLAIDITRVLKIPLVVAGQGKIRDFYEEKYDISHVEEIGVIKDEVKAKWMAGAFAVFVPTLYSEAFGAVAMETLLSGSPIITTDNGSFPEFNLHDLVGYRCRTFNEFVWAARVCMCGRISGLVCRKWAIDNYSTEKSCENYIQYFRILLDNKKNGYYWTDPIDLEKDKLDNLHSGELVPCLRQRVVIYPKSRPQVNGHF